MNTLIQFTFFGLKGMLLQGVNSSFQLNLVLYFMVAVVVLIIVVLVYIYTTLQIVLKIAGISEPVEKPLTIDWVRFLFGLIMGLVLISVYIYLRF